ncbi:hypothetical protein SCA6_006903 [Theobroma cacao]
MIHDSWFRAATSSICRSCLSYITPTLAFVSLSILSRKRELHRVYLLVSLINPRTPFPTLLGHKNKFTGQNRHLAYPHVLQNRRTGWLAINPCHVLKAEGYDREHYCRVLDTSKGRFLVGGVVYIANGRAVKSWILTARFFSTLFYLQGDSCF